MVDKRSQQRVMAWVECIFNDKYGADYRNRTGDLLITSQLLYLLS